MPKRIKIPDLIYRKLFEKKDRDGFADESLTKYLAFLVKDINLKPTVGENVRECTKLLLDMWTKNFADNLPYIRFGNKLVMNIDTYEAHNLAELAEPEPSIEKPPTHSAIVIGRGPSIFKNKHLEVLSKAISQRRYDGVICATDGMLNECLTHHIIPTLITTVDGSPIIKKWYDTSLVKKHGSKLKIALSTTVNHEVYKTIHKAGCKIFWFHPMFDDPHEFGSWTRIQRLMTVSDFLKKPLQAISCGGNTGTTSWVMAATLFKASPTCLIGMDFSYPEGTKLEDTPYFSGFMEATKDAGMIPHVYKKVYHPFFKTYAYIDAVFTSYRQSFLEFQRKTPPWYQHWGGTINATGGGALFGPEIKCMTFKKFLSKYPK